MTKDNNIISEFYQLFVFEKKKEEEKWWNYHKCFLVLNRFFQGEKNQETQSLNDLRRFIALGIGSCNLGRSLKSGTKQSVDSKNQQLCESLQLTRNPLQKSALDVDQINQKNCNT